MSPRRTLPCTLLAILAAFALLATPGCAKRTKSADEPAATGTAQETSAVATTPPAASTDATESGSGAPEETTKTTSPAPKTSERAFAYIKSIAKTAGGYEITLDYAQYLTGDTAAKAASAHGDESPPPNDYYIVNDNKRLRTFTLGNSASIRLTMADGKFSDPGTRRTYTAKKFASMWSASSAEDPIRILPYWVTVKNDVVVKVEDQYLP